MRTTHTVATLELSPGAYDEIAAALREANYDHAFVDDFIDMTGVGIKRSEVIDATPPEPDWFWRTMDPDDSGDSPNLAMACTDFFVIDEIASSYVGPTRFYFKTPTLDLDSDDEEELGFDTKEEAMAAAAERIKALKAIGKWDE